MSRNVSCWHQMSRTSCVRKENCNIRFSTRVARKEQAISGWRPGTMGWARKDAHHTRPEVPETLPSDWPMSERQDLLATVLERKKALPNKAPEGFHKQIFQEIKDMDWQLFTEKIGSDRQEAHKEKNVAGAVMCETRDLRILWPQWHTVIFEGQVPVDMRYGCPTGVKKLLFRQAKTTCWKWAAKNEYEEWKEGMWMGPTLALLRRTTKEGCIVQHRIVARKLVLKGGRVLRKLRF